MSSVTRSRTWSALQTHAEQLGSRHMRELFAQDPERARRFSVSAAGWQLDYSKNRITAETLELLLRLAEHAGLMQWRQRLFDGDQINHTEKRAVLHTALRKPNGSAVTVDGVDVMPLVFAVRQKMRDFATAVRDGRWLGYTDHRITDVINIGIGGSDLGPYTVCAALQHCAQPGLRVHFVSNVDGAHIDRVLRNCRAESTLFIVSSKSFTTQETLANALAARAWYLQQGGAADRLDRHFVAVTSNNRQATEFGIRPELQFDMWDWVGGRYSLWSAIGLPIAISIGMDGFDALLQGGHAMDEHFRTAPLAQNMPVIMALLGVWNSNFLGCQSQAILPYAESLAHLPAHLQQVDMESNGKSVDRDGGDIDYRTGPLVWGGTGTNAQHAFFQLLHQGTLRVPADFILFKTTHTELKEQHRVLSAHALAQMETLMRGKNEDEVEAELADRGVDAAERKRLAPYMKFAGNQPSNALLAERLEPQTLGALLALYEHKVFVQGVVWNINSFDQYGVEYGKQMAATVLQSLTDAPSAADGLSSSTRALIDRLRRS